MVGWAVLVGIGLCAVDTPPVQAGTRTVPLAGTASPAASQGRAVGNVAPSTAIDFEVVLSPRDGAAEQALATAVSTPGSAQYRRYLTPKQWESRFSPTRTQVAEVTRWLRSEGMRVGSVSADRLAISVSGTSAGVEHAFDTQLSYDEVEGERVRAAQGDLSVPADLASLVAGTLGLNEAPTTPDGRGASATRRTARAIAPPPAIVDPPNCAQYYGQSFDTTTRSYASNIPFYPFVPCGYTPPQLRAGYDTSALVAQGDTGAGQTVAVIDAYASPTLRTDAQAYATRNDPSHPLAASQFTEDVAHSFTSKRACEVSGWFDEQAEDVEAVHAMAPGAHILYVGAKDCNQALYNDLRMVVDHHLAGIVTASWGDDAGDVFDDAGLRSAVDNTLMMAASTGVSVVFASGDDGDEFATTGVVAPDYPPSSPWATAVGGTTLELGFGIVERAWSTATSNLCTALIEGQPGCTPTSVGTWLAPAFLQGSGGGGSGGGTSYHYAQPSYQAGVVPGALATANRAAVGPAAMRVEPDVSMDGDPGTGMLIGVTQTFPGGTRYGQFREGGTSLSAPLFAGVVALADQAAGKPLGFLNPDLYTLARTNPSVFDDVVGGSPQAQRELDYFNSVNGADGVLTTTRLVTYEGAETYCPASGVACTTRDVRLAPGPGYDDMTGLGSPTSGFVAALARL